MSHTNETVNFHLPQFTAGDKPDWLVDVNDAFQAIDTGMEATQSEAESASSTAQLAQTTAENAATTAGKASSDVAGLETDVETLQGTVNAITSLIGNGQPTTTDKTIIGAINELAAIVEAGGVSVTSDGVKTYSQIFDALFALADSNKLGENSKLCVEETSGGVTYFALGYKDAATIVFTNVSAGGSGNITQATAKASASIYRNTTWTSGNAPVVADNSAQVPTAGTVYTVKY